MQRLLIAMLLLLPLTLIANVNWVPALDLKHNQILKTNDGKIVSVVLVEKKSGTKPMYNLTINQNHDFFVGNHGGILVHNGCSDSEYESEAYSSYATNFSPQQAAEFIVSRVNDLVPVSPARLSLSEKGISKLSLTYRVFKDYRARATDLGFVRNNDISRKYIAIEAVRTGIGNCDEMVCVGLNELRARGYKGDLFHITIDKDGASHAAISIENPQSSDSVIADPWLQRIYPARTTLDNFKLYNSYTKNDVLYGTLLAASGDDYPLIIPFGNSGSLSYPL